MNLEEGMSFVVYVDPESLQHKLNLSTPPDLNTKVPVNCIVTKIGGDHQVLNRNVINRTYDNSKNYFFIKIKSRLERIETDDLLFLEADGSYSKLYLKDRIITVSNNLKVMHEKIKNSDFVRIHRKYIINISKIKYLDDNQITLENEMLLPLSDSNKSILLAKLNIV